MEVFNRFEHEWQYKHSIVFILVCYTRIDVCIVVACNTHTTGHRFDTIRPFALYNVWIRLGVVFILLSRKDIILEIDTSTGRCFLRLVAIVKYIMSKCGIACMAHVTCNIGT